MLSVLLWDVACCSHELLSGLSLLSGVIKMSLFPTVKHLWLAFVSADNVKLFQTRLIAALICYLEILLYVVRDSTGIY